LCPPWYRKLFQIIMNSSPVRNRLLLVATAILFSTGGAAIKAVSLTPWQIASFRSAIAAAVLLLVLPEARRGWSWRIAPVALAYATTMVCFVVATRLTTAADAIFLQSTAPLYLLLLSPLLLKERVHRADLVYMAAVACGMALFFVETERAMATAPDPKTGNLVALASGLSWAFTLAGLRWLARNKQAGDASLPTLVLGNVFAFAAVLPMALPVTGGGPADVAVLLYLGTAQIGLAYFCLTRAMRHVPAFEANTILLLEPAMNPLWVWMLHGERPGAWALSGGAVILAATLVNTWKRRTAA
jgi:drug/metabolite transporter (DMT)-like permease